MILLKLPRTEALPNSQPLDIDRILSNLIMEREGEYHLLYVGAKWCAPCKGLRPVFNSILAAHNDISCFEIDLAEELPYQESNFIRSLPAILLFENGKVIRQLNGLVTTDKIQQLLNAYLKKIGAEKSAGAKGDVIMEQAAALRIIKSIIAEGGVEEALNFYQGLEADVKYQSSLQQSKSLLDLLKESKHQIERISKKDELYSVYQLFKQLRIEQGLDLLLRSQEQSSQEQLPHKETGRKRQLYVKGLNTLTNKEIAKKYRKQLNFF